YTSTCGAASRTPTATCVRSRRWSAAARTRASAPAPSPRSASRRGKGAESPPAAICLSVAGESRVRGGGFRRKPPPRTLDSPATDKQIAAGGDSAPFPRRLALLGEGAGAEARVLAAADHLRERTHVAVGVLDAAPQVEVY